MDIICSVDKLNVNIQNFWINKEVKINTIYGIISAKIDLSMFGLKIT